jgi:hypothetical protein
MAVTSLHFDGPMVAGGLSYRVDELLAAPGPPGLPTGVEWIDRVTGGLAPGSLWTVLGVTGVGVTTFATRLATAAAATGTVILANGHVPTRSLARQAQQAAGRLGQTEVQPPSSLPRLASWLPLPNLGEDSWDGDCERADVVVLDTWDEMWRPEHWGHTREQRLASLRWLREVVRTNGTALLLTGRLPHGSSGAPHPDVHWAVEPFDDVADVGVWLDWSDDGSPWREATVRVRGGGSARKRLPVA